MLLPEFCLVILIGASGSGKSTFASKHFKPTEIVSSDACRGIVSDDETSQNATFDAFALVKFITRLRLKNRLLTVIDATNVKEESRKDWTRLADEYKCLMVAIILDIPENICADRNSLKPDRQFGKHVIPLHISQLQKSIKNLKYEGFRDIFNLRSVEEVDRVLAIEREPS